MSKMHHLLLSFEKKWISWRTSCFELKKIKDPRRKKIIEKFKLSETQKKEIDSFFLENYGKKIPYKWHRLYSSYTGNFDVRYIPESLFIPKIESKLVPIDYAKVLADKNLLPLLCSGLENIRTAKIYLSCSKGVLRNSNMALISFNGAIDCLSNLGPCFFKPTVDSNSGENCKCYNFKDGYDVESKKSVIDILKNAGENYNFQELLKNSNSLKTLHAESINTFRIVTYILDNKIYHFPSILRIGRGKTTLDNAHQGGIFIGVDDNGNLSKCGFTEFQDKFLKHPDSGIVFEDYKIPEYQNAVNTVKQLHCRFPQLGMISWDVTVDNYGMLVIVEMNLEYQSIWMAQMAHGMGAFGDNTEKILKMIAEKK